MLWGVVSIVFLLFNVLPSDPARLTLGQRSDLSSLENVRRELNLDKPLWQQYTLYLNDLSPIGWHRNEALEQYRGATIVSGKEHSLLVKEPFLRRSYQTKKPVWDVLMEALPGTFILALAAIVIACIMGIILGVIAAVKQNTWLDTSAIMASVAGISMPSFFAGVVIAYVFGFVLSDLTGLQMTGSLFDVDPEHGRQLQLKNLILPAITLGIRPLAIITQITRTTMLDVLQQDFIRTAYAKGLSRTRILFKHALRNALNPIITTVSGWFAELLAGSFFIETIFGWKGLGKVTVDALDRFDFPVVMGAILFTGFLFIITNMLVDVLYAIVDPRIRLAD